MNIVKHKWQLTTVQQILHGENKEFVKMVPLPLHIMGLMRSEFPDLGLNPKSLK